MGSGGCWGGVGGSQVVGSIPAGDLRPALRAKPPIPMESGQVESGRDAQAASGVDGLVDWVEEAGMTGGTSNRADGRSIVGRIVVAAVVVLVLGGAGYAYTQRNVYRVSIGPGEATTITIEVPMQRFGRAKSFAKELGLPVRCTISLPSSADGVRVSVLQTSHGLHKMRAKLRVSASSEAWPGKRTRSIEFTIDGEGDWPEATIVVKVRK